MLQQLEVKNYAIINDVCVHFTDHLNVITGETGAGKSIIIGALSLILGARANSGSAKDPNQKMVIEGIFTLPNQGTLQQFFEEEGLDYERETIIRREILPSGKSRSFINDTPVTLQQLAVLGSFLVDLHQQFDTLQLGQSKFQIQVLDTLANHQKQVSRYQKCYQKYHTVKQQCEKLREQSQQISKEKDYHLFLFNELEEAQFSENELEELGEELQTLTHAEDLKNGFSLINEILEGEEDAVISQLHHAENLLKDLARIQKDLPNIRERVSSVRIELQDITESIRQINDQTEYDEEKIALTQEKLNLGYKLLKKHGLQTTSELLALRDELEKKLKTADNVEGELRKKEKEEKELYKEASELASKISQGREDQIKPLKKRLYPLLSKVGMNNARIRVLLEKTELGPSGQDAVTFEFDANNTGKFMPIKKVASGGELSRLMLCIKSLVADQSTLSTLVFDEIESGVSGEAANQMGIILNNLSQTHQIICISHQPQIAGRADTQFQVFKSRQTGEIQTQIKQLTKQERIEVIAGMLSGAQASEAALKNAKELIER